MNFRTPKMKNTFVIKKNRNNEQLLRFAYTFVLTLKTESIEYNFINILEGTS